MLHLLLALMCGAPLAGAAVLPGLRAPEPNWSSASVLTALAIALVVASHRWTLSGNGRIVRTALRWRYPLLLITAVAPLVSLAILLLFWGEPIMGRGSAALVVEIALLQFAGGLASVHAPPNPLLGFRTPRTLADRDVWRKANRRWGRRMMIAAPLALLGLLFPRVGALIASMPTLAVGLAFLIAERR